MTVDQALEVLQALSLGGHGKDELVIGHYSGLGGQRPILLIGLERPPEGQQPNVVVIR